jgi:hypothetical protein
VNRRPARAINPSHAREELMEKAIMVDTTIDAPSVFLHI